MLFINILLYQIVYYVLKENYHYFLRLKEKTQFANIYLYCELLI